MISEILGRQNFKYLGLENLFQQKLDQTKLFCELLSKKLFKDTKAQLQECIKIKTQP